MTPHVQDRRTILYMLPVWDTGGKGGQARMQGVECDQSNIPMKNRRHSFRRVLERLEQLNVAVIDGEPD